MKQQNHDLDLRKLCQSEATLYYLNYLLCLVDVHVPFAVKMSLDLLSVLKVASRSATVCTSRTQTSQFASAFARLMSTWNFDLTYFVVGSPI